jgi:type IV secretory pathway VirJ component
MMKSHVMRSATGALLFAVLSMAIPAGAAVRADAGAPSGGAAASADAAAASASAASSAPDIEPSAVFPYERFGKVSVYRPSGQPSEVVLFLSGDGGWTRGVLTMTRRLVQRGALVIGIDNSHYLAELERAREKCVSPAVDLENLSHFIQSKLEFKTYVQPTLVGYSSGATLAYTTVAEAPDGLFKGLLTLGFCTDLGLAKPLCRGSGVESTPMLDSHGQVEAVHLVPAKKLPSPWVSLQGELDQVCPAVPAKSFMEQVLGAETVLLPKVGHGYAVERRWGTQFDAAFARVAGSPGVSSTGTQSSPVAGLPLTAIPAANGSTGPWFAVFLSGDGGWVGLDKGVSQALAKNHIPVVGWDSLKYFWSPRTPEGASQDLDRVLKYYSSLWGRSRALLIGYSQGADTLPFMVNRLPAATRRMVGLTALLGLSSTADFQFHFSNWLRQSTGGLPTRPELERWSGSPYLCLYGSQDADAVCGKLTGAAGSSVKMSGGHHFGGGYREITAEILSRLPPA